MISWWRQLTTAPSKSDQASICSLPRREISSTASLLWDGTGTSSPLSVEMMYRYYRRLVEYIQRHDVTWGSLRDRQVYKAAVCLGLNDLVEEYMHAVTSLEERVARDGPVPLSFILLHFQTYLICVPAAWGICQSIEEGGLIGCQILDLLSLYKSGIPVVQAVVERLPLSRTPSM